MGVLPLQFADGEGAESLGLDGSESFTINGVADIEPRQDVEVHGHRRGRFQPRVPRPLPHRYLQRARIFPRRRHPALRAAEAGGLMAGVGAIVATCHCGRATIRLPRTPEQVTQCNCSLCTKTGFRGVYFAIRRAGHRGRVQFLCAHRPQAAVPRQPSLQDLRYPDPLDAAWATAVRAGGGQCAADRPGGAGRRAGRSRSTERAGTNDADHNHRRSSAGSRRC